MFVRGSLGTFGCSYLVLGGDTKERSQFRCQKRPYISEIEGLGEPVRRSRCTRRTTKGSDGRRPRDVTDKGDHPYEKGVIEGVEEGGPKRVSSGGGTPGRTGGSNVERKGSSRVKDRVLL